MKEVKVPTLPYLTRNERDRILDITNTEIQWRQNENGELELMGDMEESDIQEHRYIFI